MRLSARPLEKAVGAAIVAALLILVVGLAITTHGKRLLQKSKTLKIYLPNGNDLEVGSKVTLNGLPAGSVEQLDPVVYEMEFVKEGKKFRRKIDGVLVTMLVFSPYAEKVRVQSKADVKLPFIMGSTVIDIVPGPLGSPEAPDGYVLGMKITKGIGGQIEEILGDLEIIVREFKSIEEELKKTMENVEGITSRINAGDNSIGELLSDEKRMYNELIQFARDADAAVTGLNDIIRELETSVEKLPSVMDDLKEMSSNLKPASQNLEKASRDFEPIVSDAKSTMASLEKTAEKLTRFSDELPAISRGVSRLVDADLPVLVKNLKTFLVELNKISLDLRQATTDLPALMDLLHTNMDDAQDVIKSLRGTWPISDNLPERRVVPKAIRINGRIHRLGD